MQLILRILIAIAFSGIALLLFGGIISSFGYVGLIVIIAIILFILLIIIINLLTKIKKLLEKLIDN